jgi:hypothetical protein
MKTLWIAEKIKYDGTQLASQFNYFHFGLLGPSVIAFVGPCEVTPETMLDGEDFLAGSQIRGAEMLHFCVEIFDQSLFAGVCFQRLIADFGRRVLEELQPKVQGLIAREGDDLYFEGRKLSISIAAPTGRGFVIHFAVNIVNEGTPIPTACLQELSISAEKYARRMMDLISEEYESVLQATWKVKPAEQV